MKRVNRRYDDTLSRQNWQDFERVLADYYRREGFQVEHCGTGGAGSRYDGGIDLKLRRGDEYIIVECKHWNVMQVPHNVVHQLMGIMANEGATGAILVTSGEFTPYAKEAANKLGHVQLVDGDSLRKMLGPLPALQTAPEPSAAREFASRAADQLIDAAADRIRYGSGSGRRSSRRALGNVAANSFAAILLKLGLATLMLLLGLTLIKSMTDRLTTAVSRPNATQAKPLPARQPTENPHISNPSFQPGLQGSQPNRRYSGVTAQELDRYRNSSKPTEAEIRKSQREADEAMKVIEATTPEM